MSAAIVVTTFTIGTASATSQLTASAPTSKVIIFLKNDGAGISAHSAARASFVHSVTTPLISSLRLDGATSITSAKSLPIVFASVTAAERDTIAHNPAVEAVLPDSVIKEAPITTDNEPIASAKSASPRSTPSVCGTESHPEVDPEAISDINATEATAAGYDGAGVTVAYIADGVETDNPDFSRNAAYASADSTTGSPVVSQVNFTGDPSGTATAGGEAFLDSSSIAAQGNTVYNLNDYLSLAHQFRNGCYIKIIGAAPGANVVGLDVFSTDYDTTESNFIQAIDYAVTSGVKVLNESFGSNQFPDTALDATRLADDDAVAAGVTVVASSGDSGVGNTLGSPATDPNIISAGASTTFRSYEQLTYGGINDPKAKGTWINNNISAISSSGFSQSGGNTVDVVAPGDSNWALCDPNAAAFEDCVSEQGSGGSIEFTGGTSESSPLTAAAAADVIQAYASTHGGSDPSPALVKQIIMSSATDINAPAEEQGAGLLNVYAAVELAKSIAGTTSHGTGGLLVSPNQINITQAPNATARQTVSITNTGSSAVTVKVATRALTKTLKSPSGEFCLNPSSTTSACGKPTKDSFAIWSGVDEVYQNVSFKVPKGTSRTSFTATYPYTGQNSLMHVALISPKGQYAGYSLAQGLADYARVEVADPQAGTWTAVFFTAKDAGSYVGTSGEISWQATNTEFERAGSLSASSLSIPAGATRTVNFSAKSTDAAGDAAQSIVLTNGTSVTTIPVTVRTLAATTAAGGTFDGTLYGGNGRGNPAQGNTYAFDVPAGQRDLDVEISYQDPNDNVVAFLVDPNGEALSSSSNQTFDEFGEPISSDDVQLYADQPQAGQWEVVLDWLTPVSGDWLTDPFVGTIAYNNVSISSNLPTSASTVLDEGQSYTYDVTITDTSSSSERYFLDPRTTGTQPVILPDLNGSDQNQSLPLGPGLTFPVYVVPTHTSSLLSELVGTVPVSYDMGLFTGDPDVATGAFGGAGMTVIQSGDSAYAELDAPQISPGFWYLNPSEVGPYGPGGAPAATASDEVEAVTQTFDTTVGNPTGDLWSYYAGLSGTFNPVYLTPGQSVTLPVTITPSADPSTTVTGTINVDDTFQYNPLVTEFSGGDELGGLNFTYTVGAPAS